MSTVQHWSTEAACITTAAALAKRPGLRQALIELRGPLGAGKTTFVRHLLHALGVSGRVKSPTYTLMETYETSQDHQPLHIYHFDFYRFNNPQEWEDAGFRDVFSNPGLKLVEWAEKAADLLPPFDLKVCIEPDLQEKRTVHFNACSPLGMDLLT